MGTTAEKNIAVFIDRDGTVIREKNYLRKVKEIRLISGAVEGMRLLAGKGFRLILVTNQSGVGRGYFTEEKLRRIHRSLGKMLKKRGVKLDAIYYCPHLPEDGCRCRKPRLGLVERARKRFRLDLARSYAVGDHTSDFLLGQHMGGKGIFILTGHGKEELKKIKGSRERLEPDHVAKNLAAAARWIVEDNNKGTRNQ